MLDDACFRRLAVLIDGDNISSDYADQVFAAVTKLGTPWIRRVFGSESALTGWRTKAEMYRIGMHRVQPGKNAADIKLAIHAVEILNRKRVHGYCIVSSDRDFTELVLHLQRKDAFVLGLGKGGAAACYRDACDDFVTLQPKLVPPAAPKTSGPAVASLERKQIEQKLRMLANGRRHVSVCELGSHLPKAKSGSGKLKNRLKAHGFTLVIANKELMVEVPRAA